MKRKGFKSIMLELSVMVITAVLVASLAITGYSVYSSISNNKEQVDAYRTQLTEGFKRELKNETQIAVSIIEQYHKLQESGVMSEEEAKKAAADAIRELRYDDGNGYFWIDTVEGVNVVLLGRDTEGQSRWDAEDPHGRKYIQEMIKNGQKKGGGYTNLMFPKPNETEPKPKINYTVTYEPYQWVLGTGVWVDSIDEIVGAYEKSNVAHLQKTLRNMILVLCLLLVIMVIVSLYLGKQIAAPIVSVTHWLKRMAEGDLTQFEDQKNFEETAMKRRDEIGVMANGLMKFHETLRKLIVKISETTEYLASASEELTANAQQSADASDLVAHSITTVAQACANQGGVIDAAGENTTAFTRYMGTFSDKISGTTQQINNTNKAARDGKASIDGAISQMHIIEDVVASTSDVVNGLGEQIGSIGTIVNTISEIASQTNLLSLNASIEAARAGEAGRGFAVVADEISKLADQSNQSALEIGEKIQQIQARSDQALEAMEHGLESVKSGTKTVEQTGETFAEIADMVNSIASDSIEMQNIIGQLSNGTDDIRNGFEQINVQSKSVIDETSNVSAASEEQSASMQEIATASDKLAETAQELATEVAKFEI
ncbi:methyl-accepting chemotaxis protein [Candidatus Weimeria sp. HCP3S3_B5]|uniref:methyl-accepting chemotaxis protein n=1 Tax=Candidatus Weimeria sp. HCP3S3_B5 TaxID=3438871 RepID=UPI003F891471